MTPEQYREQRQDILRGNIAFAKPTADEQVAELSRQRDHNLALAKDFQAIADRSESSGRKSGYLHAARERSEKARELGIRAAMITNGIDSEADVDRLVAKGQITEAVGDLKEAFTEAVVEIEGEGDE